MRILTFLSAKLRSKDSLIQELFWIVAFVTDAAAVNPKGTKTLLAKANSTFFIEGKPVFTKRPRKLSNTPFWLVTF